MGNMKVASVSDTHFGYPRFEADASAQGRAAILDAAKRADILILGGDIFDHRIPKMETLLEVAKLLQEAKKTMHEHGACSPYILGIHGTHERRAKDALNPIALLAHLGLMEDLHNKTTTIKFNDERVAFSGLGGLPDDLVKEALPRLACKPAPDAVNFFIFHQTLREFIPVPLDAYASIDDLPSGHDYYLCGHIHARKEYRGGKLLLSGSTVMTQQKEEEKSPKGYYLIDTVSRHAEFIPISTRPFEMVELKFDKAKPSEVRQVVEKELQKLLAQKWADKPILRIRLSGSLSCANSDLDLSGIGAGEEAFLTIDNQLDGANLAEGLSQLKMERMNRATPLELGMALLRENSKTAGLDAKRAEEMFERFSKEE